MTMQEWIEEVLSYCKNDKEKKKIRNELESDMYELCGGETIGLADSGYYYDLDIGYGDSATDDIFDLIDLDYEELYEEWVDVLGYKDAKEYYEMVCGKEVTEAIIVLNNHGYQVLNEVSKEEYDKAMEARNNRERYAGKRSWDDPDYKKLQKRRSRELEPYNKNSDYYKTLRVPGKRPGTTRYANASERYAVIKAHNDKRKEIEQKYSKLLDRMREKIKQKYMKILEEEDKTMQEYEASCKDWSIINWFSAPGCGYNPVIVQQGYKSKEEGEKDLAKFKEWAWTEVTYTDVESQCYALYPTEVIAEMGLNYKEKKVPEGKAPEFKSNPYYRGNYWGD